MTSLDPAEARRVVKTPSSLDGPPEYMLEYIKAVMSIASDDMKHVGSYVTAAVIIVTLFVTRLPIEQILSLPYPIKVVLVVGLYCLALSVLFFFRYIRKLHITRMRMARCLPTLDVVRVRELWAGEFGVWQQHKLSYKIGLMFLVFGVGSIGVFFCYLYLLMDKVP